MEGESSPVRQARVESGEGWPRKGPGGEEGGAAEHRERGGGRERVSRWWAGRGDAGEKRGGQRAGGGE